MVIYFIIPVNPGKLLAIVYEQLIGTGKAGEIASVSITDIYIKLPIMMPNFWLENRKAAHEAHIEMIFIAETLLNYMNWELNKDGADILLKQNDSRDNKRQPQSYI